MFDTNTGTYILLEKGRVKVTAQAKEEYEKAKTEEEEKEYNRLLSEKKLAEDEYQTHFLEAAKSYKAGTLTDYQARDLLTLSGYAGPEFQNIVDRA